MPAMRLIPSPMHAWRKRHPCNQAIAGVLGVNGAMALIDLDLRDNPLTDAGLNVLVSLSAMRPCRTTRRLGTLRADFLSQAANEVYLPRSPHSPTASLRFHDRMHGTLR